MLRIRWSTVIRCRNGRRSELSRAQLRVEDCGRPCRLKSNRHAAGVLQHGRTAKAVPAPPLPVRFCLYGRPVGYCRQTLHFCSADRNVRSRCADGPRTHRVVQINTGRPRCRVAARPVRRRSALDGFTVSRIPQRRPYRCRAIPAGLRLQQQCRFFRGSAAFRNGLNAGDVTVRLADASFACRHARGFALPDNWARSSLSSSSATPPATARWSRISRSAVPLSCVTTARNESSIESGEAPGSIVDTTISWSERSSTERNFGVLLQSTPAGTNAPITRSCTAGDRTPPS
ncbi:hypothetical protein P3T18_001165 [Paraburkholderia sp. GAS199]